MRKNRLSIIALSICFIVASVSGCACFNSYERNQPSNDVETSESVETETTTTKNMEEITTEEQTTESPDVTPTVEERVQELIDNMTLEEKVGQMFIARCPAEDADTLASEYALGGYILFARDFSGRTVDEVQDVIASYQSASKIPMFIGVDEEGGIVNRISKYVTFRSEPFKSPQDLFAEGGYELIRQDTIEKSRLLASLGINVNFAPVADVSTDKTDFIFNRTLGLGAKETATYVEEVVEAMNTESMGSVLKHFPGYGGNEDTHDGIAYDDREYEGFVESDFLPFKQGIKSGASMVMVAHNIVYCMDRDYPASLSAKVHKILREDLCYDGVIITDELSMEGVRQFADDSDIAVLAVQAGNDLLCCTNFTEQINTVMKAVESGNISEERIDESVKRILHLKMELGIIK